MSNEGNIKTWLLLILLKVLLWVILMKMKVSQVGCSQITGCWICYSIFRYLIYSVFYETFVKRFMEKLSFYSSNFENQFQDEVYYRKLGCLTLRYWNGSPLNITYKAKKFAHFWVCFFRNKKCWHFEIFMNQIFQ